ncbi:TetR/AcrR family transcriptional regulator [Paeniglutamicibacter sp. ABSL32-1]|uniref:TetR/AcrR family transcriptional regulator n=1 Tax=Paeniglutamicibacter quisquiliarum TaxID=2849498 RepID=UPI001C2D36FF|nr:TetR/AcrR family transcriptional regulator [Paeniglutamicibacter quisquiliarum]MBV1778059.1 TetR/AcrR family transcriptional regulator [Paeniglutamicibacter quisquiliarum]
MSSPSQQLGRRERNKLEKLERITAAASELFAKHGIEDVTTQQIAESADIGTGTLFLYAKSKGELLLLVQNAHYALALERGQAAAAKTPDVLEAVLAILTPVVECNRVQVENGRTYLREMVFGDPAEPRHAEALEIVAQTQEALAAVLGRHERIGESEATTLAGVVSAVMFLAMAASINAQRSTVEVIDAIRTQVSAILPR